MDALRAAAEDDISLAQAIVDSAGVIVQNNDLTTCYDERGAKYELPKLLILKMSVNRRNWLKHGYNLRLVLLVLWLVCYVGYGQFEDTNDFNNPAFTQMVYHSLFNITAALNQELATKAKFCVKDLTADWDKAFNFSANLDFLRSCFNKTEGDFISRICTAAEMKFYSDEFLLKTDNPGYLKPKPNRNCNLTSWVPGCEPGWACIPDHLTEQDDLPERTSNCMPCCEGFFCPNGLTCMIPCPRGSYCPLATLNETTGLCDPYAYQLPPEQLNHTCGGANVWADHSRSDGLFCSAGYYCPTTTLKLLCGSGHYCPNGFYI
ncbi:unnamed protein product [Brassica oleracea]